MSGPVVARPTTLTLEASAAGLAQGSYTATVTVELPNVPTGPYHLVVLSDHGQSQGPTFFQRYGTSVNYYIETKNPDAAPGMEEELVRLLGEHGLIEPAAENWQVLIQSLIC